MFERSASENVGRASRKTSVQAKNIIKEAYPFFMVNKNFEFLAFSVVMCARQEVMLLSEDLLYTRISSSSLSSLSVLCTLPYGQPRGLDYLNIFLAI